MRQLASRASTDERRLLRKLPASNPFAYEIVAAHSTWVANVLLIVFSILHGAIVLLCLLALLSPFIRRQPSRMSKHRWFFRKLFIKENNDLKVKSVPLLLPNSGMMMALAQLIDSLMSELYLAATYLSENPRFLVYQAKRSILMALIWIMQFYSYWVMAWFLAFSVLYIKKSYAAEIQSRKLTILSPIALNCCFVGFPIVVTCIYGFFTFKLSRTVGIQISLWSSLVTRMKEGSTLWSQSETKSPSAPDLQALSAVVSEVLSLKNSLLRNSEILKVEFRSATLFWGLVLLLAIPVHACALWQWLSLVLVRLNAAGNPFEDASAPPQLPRRKGSQGNVWLAFRAQLELRRGSINVVVRSSVVLMAMIFNFIFQLVLLVETRDLLIKPSSQAITTWGCLVSGALSAIAVVFQYWRLYVDPEAAMMHSPSSDDVADAEAEGSDLSTIHITLISRQSESNCLNHPPATLMLT